MADNPGTLRPVPDPQAEMERLAAARLPGYAKVLHLGDRIRCYGTRGEMFTGRITGMGTGESSRAGHEAFVIVCEPLEGSGA